MGESTNYKSSLAHYLTLIEASRDDDINANTPQDEATITVTSTPAREFRLLDIDNICGVHGPSDSNQPVADR